MNLKQIYRNILIAVCILYLPACDNQWDDHVDVKINREKETIMQVIESTPETSTFAAVLKKTGYDQLLSGDKSLTVFAPVNSAIGTVDMEDQEALRELVRNHIAYLSYSVVQGEFTSDTIVMINLKRLKTDGLKIDNVSLKTDGYNITTANGLLHIVEGAVYTKDNIWEYLQKQSGYPQVEYLKSITHQVMDMENSIQIGIGPDGLPFYDTVWIERNVFLENYPLNNESDNFTFILLDPNVINKIESKYAKYYARSVQQQQDSIVRGELLKDCVLLPVEITADRKYASVDGILMDISPANISGSPYQASNGTIYKLTNADVKVYQNKLKDILIEAEDAFSRYSNNNSWSVKYRTWASGGETVMLNSVTRNFFRDSIPDEEGGKIYVNETYSYNGGNTQSGYAATVANCYLEFRPLLNSVAYKISCVPGDDIAAHYDHSVSTSEYWYPMVLEQKLLISFPEAPRLERVTSPRVGIVNNNFSETTAFVSKLQSREITDNNPPEETYFYRYNVDTGTEAVKGIYVVPGITQPIPALEDPNIYAGSDEYGDKETLICPRYGESTVFVANAVRETGVNSGMLFLDYIKFSPVVDPND